MKKVGRNVSKALALILSFVLVLCLVVQPSHAGTFPAQVASLSDLVDSLVFIPGVSNRDQLDYCLDHITAQSSVCVSYYPDAEPTLCIYLSESGELMQRNGYWYCSEPSTNCYGGYFSSYSSSAYMEPNVSSNVPYIDEDQNLWYQVPGVVWYDNSSVFEIYHSQNVFDYRGGTYSPANLDISSYQPVVDPRILMVSKVTLGGLDYIEIDVNDDDIDYPISVGVDYRLPNDANTYTAYYFYDSGDFLNLTQVEGLDGLFYQWNLNPNKIFGYEFEVVGATYYGSYSYGEKSVSGLSLTFNEDELVSDPPININNTYYNSTLQSYYVPGTKYNVYTFRSDYNFVWDSDRYFSQPFNFSYCAVPDIPSVNFTPDSALIDELLKIYDVVIYVVSSNEFDYFYQSGAYQTLVSSWNSNEPLTSLTEFYSLYDPLPFLGFNEDPTGQFQVTWTNSVIISDRFYFKQANYLLGDTDDILTQFSSRFFEEDGFSMNLFSTLNALYENQFSFYNAALPTLNRLSYWLVDNHVDFSLENITNLLQRADNSLDHLIGIDSDLDDLVSDSGSLLTGIDSIITWLDNFNLVQNFELTLPSFDFGSVVQVFGGNIDSFGDWVNELVLVLPDLDYSDFDDWFTNSGNLLTGIDADTNFLGHLGDPYDYSDSGVNYLGWD